MVMPPLSTLVSPIVNEPSLVKSTALFKAKVNTPLVRLTLKFLPALRVSLSPADIAWPSEFESSVLSVTSSSLFSAFAYHLALLIISATLLTVVTLSPSPDFAWTWPFFGAFSPVPFAVTSSMTPLSFGFTVEVIVTVRLPLPSASDTVTSVPSPPLKLTSLPGLTIPFEVPPWEIFQPLALIASATSLLVVKPVAVGVLALPSALFIVTALVVAVTVWVSTSPSTLLVALMKLVPLTSIASRAAFFTAFSDTLTRYLAPLSPSFLLPSTVTLAMFVSPSASAALATDSVEILSFNCL